MPEQELPISLTTKSGNNSDYRDSLPENMVIVRKAVEGSEAYIKTHPGLTEFATGEGADRGGVYNARLSSHFRISGTKLIELDSVGTKTVIGSIPGTTQTSLPYSFQTQAILSNNRLWLYDGTTLTEILDPDLGAPIDITWINGVYFMTDGEFLFHTEATSEFDIEPEKFATSEFSPDRTLAVMKTQENQVLVFNRFSCEWFTDTGTSVGFRFRRINGKAVKTGIVGTHCKCELDGRIFILGSRIEEDPSIHILSGGSQTTVASREVDEILSEYTEAQLSTAVLESRVQKKQKYLIVRLPNHTLLYNHTIGSQGFVRQAWTILKSDLYDTPWRAVNGVYDPDASKWIYGDRNDESIAYIDDETFTQYGEQQECVFYSPVVRLETASINMFEIDQLPGRHTEQMNAFFSMSYDGVTYGTEYSMAISNLGQYNQRFMANRLGYVRYKFNFKFRMVSDAPMSFSGLRIDFD